MNFKRMRTLLLELAIQGKLVPQHASSIIKDFPVRENLETSPFVIPKQWVWLSAKDAFELLSGRDLTKSEILDAVPEGEAYPYITGASQIEGSTILINRWTKNCAVKSVKGDLLITCKGTVGKTAFNTIGDMHIARQIMALRANVKVVEPKYLKIFIDAIAEKLGKEAKSMIPGIDRNTLLNKFIPLPPLEEQTRIVAKLEEAFDEIGRAEKAYEELQTLAGVLRGQILQEAIQGKLIPQLDSEEEVQQIGDAPKEVPFAIPEKWKWVTLSELVPKIVDCPHSTPKYSSEETKFLAIDTNCITPVGVIKSWRYVTEEIYKQRVCRLEPQKDDIIYTREGSIGRAARLPDGARVCMGQRVMLIRPGTHLEPSYLQWYLMSHCALSHLTAKQRGIGVKHINVSDVKKLPIPVPPVLEQRRIVAKIEELFQDVEKISR